MARGLRPSAGTMATAWFNGISSVLLVAACSSRVAPAPDGGATSAHPPAGTPPSGPSANDATPGTPPDDAAPDPTQPPPPLDPIADPATYSNPEVVEVLMKDRTGVLFFCTGTLVAKDVVITAGHCVDPSKFASYEVIAETLASHPRVAASRGAVYDPNWDENTHPDLGLLKLSAPILLGAYAKLTDVSALVDAGQTQSVGAIVRDAEQPQAPFMRVGPFSMWSATGDGYPNSYSVPMFSKGGDSGCGFFLVENGVQTHKLVAVEHDPDPARGVDHVSRVDAAFIQWVQAHSADP